MKTSWVRNSPSRWSCLNAFKSLSFGLGQWLVKSGTSVQTMIRRFLSRLLINIYKQIRRIIPTFVYHAL